MQGDLLLPHCGIHAGMRGRLRRQVNYVVHCAASIIFNEHVHTLLANNYQVDLSSCSSCLLCSRFFTLRIWVTSEGATSHH